MEPLAIVGISSAVVRLLAPFFKSGAEEVAKSAGGELGKSAVSAAFAKAKQVYELVKVKLSPHPQASEALVKLQSVPDDVATQNALESELKQSLEADHAFAEQLAQLLKEITATKAEVSFVNNIQGEVQKLVNIGTVVGNVSI